MESLCINQLVVDKDPNRVVPYRLCDYVDGKLINKESNKPSFLNYDYNVILEEGNVAIWEWSDGVWAEESKSSESLCELISIAPSESEDEKVIKHNLRKKLKEGIKLKQYIDSRRNLFIMYKPKECQGVILKAGDYKYKGGTLSVEVSENQILYCKIYRIPDKDLIRSNGAVLLEKRREFILSTDLVAVDSSLVINDVDDVALIYLDKYRNQIIKCSRGNNKFSSLIKQLLHSKPLESNYPDYVEQYFKDEDVCSALEARLTNSDLSLEFINSFLKSNESFRKSCEDSIREEVNQKNKEEFSKAERDLNKAKEKAEKANESRIEVEEQTRMLKDQKNNLDAEIVKITGEKSELELELANMRSEYESKKKELDDDLEVYKASISNKKTELDLEISKAEEDLNLLNVSKTTLNDELNSFLRTFGNNSLNKSILPELLKEISKYSQEQTKSIVDELKKINSMASVPTIPIASPIIADLEKKNILHIPGEIKDDAKKCSMDDIEDALDNNLRDCGLSKHSSELASYLQAAIISERAIIVCGDRFDCIANSISLCLQGSLCDRLVVSNSNSLEILNIVNNECRHVVSIDGVLNTLDYSTFFTLTKYSKKLLVFVCNDLRLLQTAPIELWSSAVLVDLTLDPLMRSGPEHSDMLSSRETSELKNTVNKVFVEEGIDNRILKTEVSEFLHRLSTYDRELSTTYLKRFLCYLAKISDLNSEER